MIKKLVISTILSLTMLSGLAINAKPVTMIINISDFTTGYRRNFSPFSPSSIGSVEDFVYERLMYSNMAKGMAFEFRIAEGYTLSKDLKTINLKIRNNIKWSDGKQLTAKDVYFTMMLLKNNPGLDRGSFWIHTDSVELVDDYNLKFHMKQASAFNISYISGLLTVPEHIWKDIKDPLKFTNPNPVGSGPFTTIQRFTSQIYTLCRNPYYWQADLLKIDCLKIPQYNGNEAVYNDLSNGRLDWAAVFIPNIKKLYLDKDKKHHHYWFPAGDAVRLTLNITTKNKGNNKAFNNISFRKAVSMAMDRKSMIDIGGYGYMHPVNTVSGLPIMYKDMLDDETIQASKPLLSYNIQGAKDILAKAGFKDVDGDGYVENPDGSKINFKIQVPSGWTDWINNASIAAEGLKKIGVQATIITPEVQSYSGAWANNNFEAQIAGSGLGQNIWNYYNQLLNSKFAHTSIWWSTAMTNYSNPKIDSLLDTLSKTVDKKDRKKLVNQLETKVRENMPFIALYYNAAWNEYSTKHFTGWPTPDNFYAWPASFASVNRLSVILHLKPVK